MELNKKIKFNTIVVQTTGLDAVDMDEEKVMMNMDRGKYYAFNSIGSRIWELIDKPRSVRDIISKLVEEYDVDTEMCQDNVLAFINRLYDEELVCIR